MVGYIKNKHQTLNINSCYYVKFFFFRKFNNFNVARLLRQIIPRPQVVPKFGQSTERFIIMDFKQDKYKIPDTECNNSFLLTLKGSRIVELKPAEECKHECKSFKLELKESYLCRNLINLFYRDK